MFVKALPLRQTCPSQVGDVIGPLGRWSATAMFLVGVADTISLVKLTFSIVFTWCSNRN